MLLDPLQSLLKDQLPTTHSPAHESLKLESDRRGFLLLGINENAQKAAVSADRLVSRSWNVTGSNANHLSQANFSPSEGLNTGSCSTLNSRPCWSNRFENLCLCVCVCTCMPVCVGFLDNLGCHSSRYHSDSHWPGIH